MTSKLEQWQAVGLIDAATADAIRAYEAQRHRPVGLWAVVGLGLLALLLGVSLVVAANWDVIPGSVKLAAHWGITAALALLLWWAHGRSRPLIAEGALFLLAGFVLAGIALQGQVYQLTAPTWHALAWWALLVSPIILLTGSTRLTAIGWSLMLTWAAIDCFTDLMGHGNALTNILITNLPFALPPLLIAISLLLRQHDNNKRFLVTLQEAGLALLLAGASLAHFLWVERLSPADSHDALIRLPLSFAIALLVAFFASRRADSNTARLLRVALIASAIAVVLAFIPHSGNDVAMRLIGALSFVAMWGVIGKAAYDSGWRKLFNLAVGMVALRLFIVYFELFGSMAQTGGGLIIAGLLMIGLAVAWQRITRRRPA